MDILISEILDKVSKAKTKQNKVALLKQYNSPALRMVIKSSFDPKIKWALPEGEVPFKRNDAPAGTEHSVLSYESRKLYHYIEGGNNVQMLEGLHETEADVLIAAKDGVLHQMYKGLSANVVKEAFNWTDEFMVDEHAVYHQMPGPANG
jgi:hypothetical protein